MIHLPQSSKQTARMNLKIHEIFVLSLAHHDLGLLPILFFPDSYFPYESNLQHYILER